MGEVDLHHPIYPHPQGPHNVHNYVFYDTDLLL